MKALLTLSLILIYGTVISQPTNAQVFNFAVGDTFVYQMGENVDIFEMMVVLARQDGGDSTVYTLQHYFNYDSTHNYLNHNTVHQIITQDTSIFSTSSFSNSFYPVANYCFCLQYLGIGGSSNVNPNSWCDSTMELLGTCAHAGAGSYDVFFAKGLGIVYINSYCYDGSTQRSQYCNLVYYHLTNGAICGVANYYILGVSDLTNDGTLIQIVPNPANAQFEVKMGQSLSEEANFTLFDARGKMLLSQRLTSNHTMIQRQGISSGIYFWRVDVSGKTIKAGKMAFE